MNYSQWKVIIQSSSSHHQLGSPPWLENPGVLSPWGPALFEGSWKTVRLRLRAFCLSAMTRPGKLTVCYGKIHHFQWENPLLQWPFSIAMLNYQRVSTQCCAFCMANFAELMPWPNHLLTVAYRCLLLFVPPIKIPVTQWLLPFLGHIPPPSTLSSTTWVLLVIYHIDTMHTFSPSTQCSVTVGYVSIYIYILVGGFNQFEKY